MDEKKYYAMKNNAFVRDTEADIVYCPQGQILRKKSVKKDGRTRYVNKSACRLCEKKCISSGNSNYWKEIDFYPHVIIKEHKKKTAQKEREA